MNNPTIRCNLKRHSFSFLILMIFFIQMFWPVVAGANESEVRSFNLQEARKYAIQHNYDAKKSSLDVALAKKVRKETVGAGLPQISSTINYQNNLELPTVLIPDFFNDPNDKIEIQFKSFVLYVIC